MIFFAYEREFKDAQKTPIALKAQISIFTLHFCRGFPKSESVGRLPGHHFKGKKVFKQIQSDSVTLHFETWTVLYRATTRSNKQ